MPDFIGRFASFLGSISPRYWTIWVLIAGFNLFFNVTVWVNWSDVTGDDALGRWIHRWETSLKKAVAWGIITWPISGFVLFPAYFLYSVVFLTDLGILIIRDIILGTYRIACEVISTAAGKRK